MIKKVQFVLYMVLIWAVITLGFSFFIPNQPLNGAGDCGSNYLAKDETDPFEYDGEQLICGSIVKAGSQVQGEACFSLTIANPNDGCYAATGLGTNSVRVRKVGGDECKGISHVEFYPCQQEEPTDIPTSTLASIETPTSTQTSTSTSTVTPTGTEIVSTATNTPTPSQTLETPWKFWTSTPITVTPTSPDITITATPKDFPTPESPTPTYTITPPDGEKTPTVVLPPGGDKTPQVALPATGVDGSNTDETMLRFGFAFVLSVIGLFILRYVWRILKNE